MFTYKDKLPKNLQSSVIYQYSCPQECGSVYVGSTTRTLETRIAEHFGVSIRTNRALTSPPHSSIRAHYSSNSYLCSGGSVSPDQFVVVDGCKGVVNLRILESLYICRTKPNLNEMASAFPLKIVDFWINLFFFLIVEFVFNSNLSLIILLLNLFHFSCIYYKKNSYCNNNLFAYSIM